MRPETRALAWTPRYADLVTRRLESDIFPVIGKYNIAHIRPRKILAAIRRIEDRGAVKAIHAVTSAPPCESPRQHATARRFRRTT
ncbi:phage integrase central domain-containing protein [Novosphingobium sp. MBES04]|uniref:phage integrase central domain-containing protein n=1 Tax=Novosphingobium sp. MBES04 TaxID=1206458 RepID=UPI000A926749